MWERERADRILEIALKSGLKRFRTSTMDGSSWDMNRKEFGVVLVASERKYLMYRVYVEGTDVFLEIMTY